jgi:hypothetical protein
MRNVIVLAAALVVAGVGCGGDDDDVERVTTRVCNFAASSGYCMAVAATPSVLNDNGLTQQSCEAEGGVFAASCPSENRVGRCTQVQGDIQMVTHLYAPTFDASFATACTGTGGTWQAN